MTTFGKIAYYTHRSQKRKYTSCHRGHTGKKPVLVRRQKKRCGVGKHLYYGFCKKEQNRQGRQA